MTEPHLRNFEQQVRWLPHLDPSLSIPPFDLIEPLKLYTDPKLSVYFVPFNYLRRNAKIAVIGITPGWQQMAEALNTARDAMAAGGSPEAAEETAKYAASFKGTMRSDLVKMLDDLGVHQKLNIATTNELWGSARPLLHSSSSVRMTTFWTEAKIVKGKNGKPDKFTHNYNGTCPKPLDHPFTRDMIDALLSSELAALPDALIVPLGIPSNGVIRHLSDRHGIDPSRCLLGFPHTSGASSNRWKIFEARKADFAQKVEAWNPS